ncbi:hypothetical protein [Nocardia rhizosphaerae]|uniref:Uncharacterized protein n=1 Tax=Nocardia rhizosphaerae TaxID=1691571 RepID=A0ABV8LDD2_9NOCA
MAFTPIRLVAPDGRTALVGSATEREQLLARGYSYAPDPKPTTPARPAPAPVVAREPERKPAPKPEPKTSK